MIRFDALKRKVKDTGSRHKRLSMAEVGVNRRRWGPAEYSHVLEAHRYAVVCSGVVGIELATLIILVDKDNSV